FSSLDQPSFARRSERREEQRINRKRYRQLLAFLRVVRDLRGLRGLRVSLPVPQRRDQIYSFETDRKDATS
ncbi:MAG: hypothetical protein ABI882_22720, partial [Acidobacteriota bacterium]